MVFSQLENFIMLSSLIDESNYTPGQLIAYDKYLDGIMTWNSTMVQSFDNGFDDGILKAKKKAEKKVSYLAQIKRSPFFGN